MIQEKLNNGNWKEGLEDVNNLPDYILQNKHAAWENLHNRLHEKQRRTGFAWYWMAAACLIIASSIILITTNKKNDVALINAPIKIQRGKIISPQPLNKINIDTKSTALNTIKKNALAGSNKKHSINIINVKEKTANDSIVQINVIDHEIQIALPVLKDSIKQNITAVIPMQKKMKVVHINELDNSNNLNMTQSTGHLPLRIKFLNRDIYTDYTIQPATTGFNILKLNSSPSN